MKVEAAERFAWKSHHAERAESADSVMYCLARSLFFSADLNRPVEICY